VLGLGAVLAVVPWWWLAGDDHPGLAPRRTIAPGPAPQPLLPLLRSPVLWGTLLGTFSYQYFNYFCMTWMQAYFIERRHLSPLAMSVFSGASFGGFALVAVAGGYWADRLIAGGGDPVNVRRRLAMAGLVLASTELIGALSSSSSVALFFAVFSLVSLGLTTANYWALTQTLLPGAGVGRIVGVQNFAANLPGIVAPLFTGWLKQRTGGYEAPMAAAAAFLVLGVLSYRFLVRREYAPRPYA
jgi:ACS family D-galactonate transporter-like MFS transporter